MTAPVMLSRADVERVLTPAACIAAVEEAFRGFALGKVPKPGILGMHEGVGSFHVKAGFLTADRPYFAAKLNANFPGNAARGLPTIQGAVLLFDATDGTPLAVMDSGSITAIRTAAATGVATRHLARESCEAMLLCGCGAQAARQLQAVLHVRKPKRVFVHDVDPDKARSFAASAGAEPAMDLAATARRCDLIVTCTTATRYFITRDMVRPGTFIAAVGADNESKQEIEPGLLAAAKLITDLTEQAAKIGDLHHAIEAGVMGAQDVHAELGEVVAGLKPGRAHADEVIVFDSTGTGLQDVAAAVATFRRMQS